MMTIDEQISYLESRIKRGMKLETRARIEGRHPAADQWADYQTRYKGLLNTVQSYKNLTTK